MTFQATIDAHDRMQRNWLSDLAAALRKIMRVTKAGRRLCLAMPLVVLAACGGGGGGGGSTGGGSAGGGGTTTSTISGMVSPVSLGAGVRVTLSGAAAATATVDASGNYSFPGLANGAYTVTASGTSLTFSPASTAVTVSGSSMTGVNFTATATGGGGPTPNTLQISGTISPSALGANVPVTLVNTATSMTAATTTTDTSGNFAFTALANGSYTVMPSGGASLTFSPTDRPVTLNGSNATGVNFTASTPPGGGGGGGGTPTTWAISGIVSPTSLGAGVQVALSGASTATMTTNSSGAFNFSGLANGAYAVTPSGTSLSFSPANRAVAVSGANEAGVNFTASAVTYAISGKVSPMSLGANVTVALSGASAATTTTNASGDFSFSGLANGSYTVTPSAASKNFTPASKPVVVSGGNQTNVDFTAMAIPPNTYSISGTVGSGSLGANVTVTLSGASGATTTTNSSGAYSFSGLVNGSYTVTPSSASRTFSPGNRAVSVNGANVVGVDFMTVSYTISGRVTPTSLGVAQVALSGASTATTTTNASGDFTFSGLLNGSYTVTPSAASRSFSPASQLATVNGANVTGVNFTASAATYSISGTVTPSSLGAGVQVALSGASTAATTTNSSGVYSFTGLANGSYTITPSGTSLSFNPTSRVVPVNGSNVAGMDFTASTSSNVFFFDDFNGSALGSAWTALDRSGPGSQSENLCNKPSAVTVSGGNLVITTSATPATCGDAVSSPSQFPYTSGSIQWTNLNFTYGTVEIRAKFPPRTTGTWPALWLLGSECQAANIVNGSEAVPFMGCPAQGQAAYREIDMVECDTRSWCHLVLAQGSFGWGNFCDFPVDANWHVFSLTWNASTLSLSIDGSAPAACTLSNQSIKGPVFLIIQTQTTYPAGVGGQVNNAALPTTLQVDYVRVTQ